MHLPIFIALLLLNALSSCNNDSSTGKVEQPIETNTEIKSDHSAPVEPLEKTTDPESFSIKAKFIEFELGDAAHYIFEDESGKMWDFGGCNADNLIFERELSDAEYEENEASQGFGSNKELQNKWFMLTYVKREQPQYQDGPIGIVEIITKVALVE